MMDTINTERYSVISQKFLKMKSNPLATGSGYGPLGSGLTYTGDAEDYDYTVMSRATRIIKGWIPASKFCTGGVLTYENGSHSQVKFYDYTPVLYAYSNYSTIEYFVARVNEYVGTLVYTDA